MLREVFSDQVVISHYPCKEGEVHFIKYCFSDLETVMETEKKKYNQMENVLNKINQKYISLPENEKTRNNIILQQVSHFLF